MGEDEALDSSNLSIFEVQYVYRVLGLQQLKTFINDSVNTHIRVSISISKILPNDYIVYYHFTHEFSLLHPSVHQ